MPACTRCQTPAGCEVAQMCLFTLYRGEFPSGRPPPGMEEKPDDWRAMVYAPLDGTKVELLIRHHTWWTARKSGAAAAWQGSVLGHWVDFNGGGWCWSGMSGDPIGWRPFAHQGGLPFDAIAAPQSCVVPATLPPG